MTNWIDFEVIKRRIPIAAVLRHYRIDGLRRSGKAHLRGPCPLHEGDGRDTLHVDTAEQISTASPAARAAPYSTWSQR